jgi:glycolate oxidase iron-sulfur subunit
VSDGLRDPAGESAASAVGPLRDELPGLLACVHCGFCLNACPTYTRLGHEGDSPRGRLDLMRAVVEGRLEPDDPAYRLHIDRCLGCRACEPVCPSGVPYGFLLERARAAIARSAGVSFSTRLLIAAYTGPLHAVVTLLSRGVRATRLAGPIARLLPARFAGSLRFALAMLAASAPWPGLRRAGRGRAGAPGELTDGPRAVPADAADVAAGADRPGSPAEDAAHTGERAFADPHALMAAYPRATGSARSIRTRTGEGPRKTGADDVADGGGRVAVLTGCVQQSLFARVNAATARVLAANGCRVVAVPGQQCCGALDVHAGRLDRAADLARANIAAFEAAGADAVVVNAAGCGAMMKEYGEQLKHDVAWRDRAHGFSARVRDLAEYLVERGVRTGAPVALRVTYDAPCHLHHGQRIREAPLQLLDSVPGLERVPLADADECCGGAGLYGVHHPGLGGRILADKLAAIRATGAEVVLTPNPGCIMQIGAGLLLAGDAARVLHPVEILDESYRRAGEEMTHD